MSVNRIEDRQRTLSILEKILNSSKPELVGRIPGGLSLQAMTAYLHKRGFSPSQKEEIAALTGFFSAPSTYEENLYAYANAELSALRRSTLCLRNSTDSEDVALLLESIVEGYVSDVHVWSSDNIRSWVPLLEGKRVLIVSAFAETMAQQWAKRKNLHNTHPEIKKRFDFPEFDAVFIQSPLTVTGCEPFTYTSWNEAFHHLCMKVDQVHSYDVALLSCGAYAMPLGGHILDSGNTAWNVGGILQTVFGIRGNRWSRAVSDISGYYNSAWVDPSIEETPNYHPSARPDWDNFWRV